MRELSGASSFTLPAGESASYVEHFASTRLSVGNYSLAVGAVDGQSPHDQDEVYVVISGRARFTADGVTIDVGPGSVLFVPAGEPHHFGDVTEPLSLVVMFAPPYSSAPDG